MRGSVVRAGSIPTTTLAQVLRLVVNSRGAAAWLASGAFADAAEALGLLDARGGRVVDREDPVVITDVQLGPKTLSWHKSGHYETAPVH